MTDTPSPAPGALPLPTSPELEASIERWFAYDHHIPSRFVGDMRRLQHLATLAALSPAPSSPGPERQLMGLCIRAAELLTDAVESEDGVDGGKVAAWIGEYAALEEKLVPLPAPSSPDRLAEIEGRLNAAHFGPWDCDLADPDDDDCGEYHVTGYTGGVVVELFHEGNAQFIAHARDDVPWLLAEVARLTEERNRISEREIAARTEGQRLMAQLTTAAQREEAALAAGREDTILAAWLLAELGKVRDPRLVGLLNPVDVRDVVTRPEATFKMTKLPPPTYEQAVAMLAEYRALSQRGEHG